MIKWKNKNRGDFYEGLFEQVRGLLDIEIGNYMYEHNLKPFIVDDSCSLNVYIFDPKTCSINEYNDIVIPTDLEKYLEIGHYHREDLLWLIMNFKQEKKYMIKKIDEWLSICETQNKADSEGK